MVLDGRGAGARALDPHRVIDEFLMAELRVQSARLGRSAAVEDLLGRAQSEVFGGPGETGRGTTVNMASQGLLVATDRRLPPGASVELAIEWPARLNSRAGLKLVVHGSVLRSEEGKLAVLIRKHEFRLAGRYGPAPA